MQIENLTFTQYRIISGWTREECLKNFEIDERTLKKWETNKVKPPRAVFLCLALAGGFLDLLGENWRGFRLLPDCIISKDGAHLWPHEINAIQYVYQSAGIERYKFCRILVKPESQENAKLSSLAGKRKKEISPEILKEISPDIPSANEEQAEATAMLRIR